VTPLAPSAEGVLAVRLAAVTADIGTAEQYRIGFLVAPRAIEAARGVALGCRVEAAERAAAGQVGQVLVESGWAEDVYYDIYGAGELVGHWVTSQPRCVV
jgi:hypothetical protein